jgi:hypothetical protein
MSLNNLATIFGPTLLHPAIKDESKVSPTMKMMQGAHDVFIQAGVLYYFFDIRTIIDPYLNMTVNISQRNGK